jgi:prepilin-type N-terminal cleavage/methylation domain-containing protein
MKSGLSRRDKHLRMLLRMLPKRTDRRGFTLIELLVAILISGLIVSGLLYLVVEVLGINQKDSARSDTQRDMQMTMDYITRDLRESFYVYGAVDESTSNVPGSPTDLVSCLSGKGAAAADGRGQQSLCPGILNYLPAYLTPADNSNIPVLAFWKPEPLPDSVASYCRTNAAKIGAVLPDPNGNPLPSTIDRVPCIAQRMYTLVVYSLSTENPNNIWRGKARIKRYTLPHFPESSVNGVKSAGWVAPVASDDKRPLSWPFGKANGGIVNLQANASSATVPAAGTPAVNVSQNVVLTDFVNSVTPSPSPPSPLPITNGKTGYCESNFEVANFANFTPSFYACVRKGSTNENPEVRVVIQGNAAGRGSIPKATGDVPFQMEAQVMGRGVYAKQRSGS